MVELSGLVVCSVCHADLALNELAAEGAACCPRCGRRYNVDQGTFNMIPIPPPDGVLKAKWQTWQKLQDNGLQSYTQAPEINLSIGSRDDAQAFKAFSQPSGLILDVGCGPQPFPSYLPEKSDVVGIDPLAGAPRRDFAFVRGIGEYLPFRDGTFDHIVYASSLDHIIDPRRSLADAARCLKPDGYINLWIDGLASSDSPDIHSPLQRYMLLARKGIKSLSRHGWLTRMGVRRTVSYVGSVARMTVPEGATDYFHFMHLNLTVVLQWLRELNLVPIRQQDYPEADSLFIIVKK